MDPVNHTQLYDYLGGGWVSLLIVLGVGALLGWLKWAEQKAARDRAQRLTDESKVKDQAAVPAANQHAQDEWDKSNDEIHEIIEKFDEEDPKEEGNS